jgi:hypothetical protein
MTLHRGYLLGNEWRSPVSLAFHDHLFDGRFSRDGGSVVSECDCRLRRRGPCLGGGRRRRLLGTCSETNFNATFASPAVVCAWSFRDLGARLALGWRQSCRKCTGRRGTFCFGCFGSINYWVEIRRVDGDAGCFREIVAWFVFGRLAECGVDWMARTRSPVRDRSIGRALGPGLRIRDFFQPR